MSQNWSLWRTVPLTTLFAEQEKTGLKRNLGPVDLVALGVGAIIGTGIFVMTGVAASQFAGPGLVLSFILAGIAAGLAALVYAELASTIPVAGSAYTYTYAVLGEFVAW
ncbi:MAG: amino acid permease, partial [Bacillota bacterium]